jgi:hypothetical protein
MPPEAALYASAFDSYLRATPDGPQEQRAAEWMSASLALLAEGRLSGAPVRATPLQIPIRTRR